MGAWGAGIFENDDAADWANDFDETDPAERLAFIEDTFALTDDVDHGQLDIDDCSAVLAAAVVAAQLPNGPRLDTTYGPQILGDGPRLTVPRTCVKRPSPPCRQSYTQTPNGLNSGTNQRTPTPD